MKKYIYISLLFILLLFFTKDRQTKNVIANEGFLLVVRIILQVSVLQQICQCLTTRNNSNFVIT